MKRRLLAGALTMVLLLSGALGWLLWSTAGLGFIVKLAGSLSGGMVTVGDYGGRLAGSWRLVDLSVHAPETRVEAAEVAFDWAPGRLVRNGELSVSRLRVRSLVVTLVEHAAASDPAAQSDEPFNLPAVSLPIAILLGDLRVDGLQVNDAQGEAVLVIDEVSARLAAERDRLSVEALEVRAPDYAIELRAGVQLDAGWPVDLSAGWQARLPDCSDLAGTVQVAGPLAGPSISVVVDEPVQVEVSGTISDLFNDISWQLQGHGEQVELAAVCPDLPVGSVDLVLAASGRLDDYRASINAAVRLPDLPEISGSLVIGGTMAGATIEQGTLLSGAATASLNGEVGWQGDLSGQIGLAVRSFDTVLVDGMPPGIIDADLIVSGAVDGEQPSWQVLVDNLRYLLTDQPDPLRGTARIDGTDTQLRATAELAAGTATLAVAADVAWVDELRWSARLAVAGFNPALFGELPSGLVSGVIHGSGSGVGDELALQATLEDLSGTLAGYDLQGGGSIDYHAGQLHFDDLRINNGNNRLSAHGVIDDHLALVISVDAADLQRLYQPLGGTARLTAELSGSKDEPVISGDIHVVDLTYQDLNLAEAAGQLRFGHRGPETIEAELSVYRLSGDGFTVTEATLAADGSLQQQQVRLSLVSDFGTAAAVVAGRLDEQYRWSGQLRDLSYAHDRYGGWRQRGPATVTAAETDGRIDDLCLDTGGASLCVSGSWDQQGPWRVEMQHLHLALELLNRWGLVDMPISGTVQGSLAAAGNDTEFTLVAGQLTAPVVTVDSDLDGLYEELSWFENRFDVSLTDAVLTTRLSSRFGDDTHLLATLTIASFTGLAADFTTLPVSGRIEATRLDLAPLAVLTDDYLLPSGHLQLDLLIDGVLGQPSLAGSIAVVDGTLGFPELGSSLEQIHGTLGFQQDRLQVELEAEAGDGRLRADGFLDFGNHSWYGEFVIVGTDCEIMNQTELRVVASPELRLIIDGDGGFLDGSLHIPEALVQPEEMRGSVSASSDVVFVDEEETVTAWPFQFEIDVTLGDEIHIKGYGLTTRLTGRLFIVDDREKGLTGRGELVVNDGTFALYGRALQISRGRIIYADSAIDNPDLDIVVQKTVRAAAYGQEGLVVGVKVTGSAHDYHLELFSQPRLADNDIVAYLLLDKPISSGDDEGRGIVNEAVRAIGLSAGSDILSDLTGFLPVDDLHLEGGADAAEASVVVGKRLTDDLTISYDFNLFEYAGSFRVRYEFGRGFSVQSRSSVESNGIEFIYSFER